MGVLETFADAYLSGIINERDRAARRATIRHLMHPNICHSSFDRTVYGRDAVERRIDELVTSIGPQTHASLLEPARIEGETVFFRWQLADVGQPPVATGGAFVVITSGLAVWLYATVTTLAP